MAITLFVKPDFRLLWRLVENPLSRLQRQVHASGRHRSNLFRVRNNLADYRKREQWSGCCRARFECVIVVEPAPFDVEYPRATQPRLRRGSSFISEMSPRGYRLYLLFDLYAVGPRDRVSALNPNDRRRPMKIPRNASEKLLLEIEGSR